MKILYLFLVGFLSFHCVADDEIQVWKSPAGHSFEGEFLALEADQVLLEGKNGREISVPLAALDLKSQAMAREAAVEAEKFQAVFISSNPSVEIQVRSLPNDGILQVTLLEGAEPIPYFGKVNVRMRLRERRRKKKGGVRMHKIPLKEVIPEEIEHEEAKVRLRYENDVEVLLNVKAIDEGVKFSYRMEDPPPDLPKLSLWVTLHYPPLLEYDPKSKTYKGILSTSGITFEHLESLLSDYEIDVRYPKGNQETFGFFDSPPKLTCSEMTLKTPARQDVFFEVTGEGRLQSRFYGGKKIAEGFGIRFYNMHELENDSPEFCIRLK